MTQRPLRILHVITDLDVGGAESMLAALVTSREPSGLEHIVVSLLPNGALAPQLRKAGVTTSEFNFKSLLAPLELARLAKLIRNLSPDAIQGWMYHGNLAASLALTLAGRRSQTALAWGIRCSDMDLTHYAFQLRVVVHAGAVLSKHPDILTANSEAGMASHLQLGYAPRRHLVVPNGIDVDRFQPDPAARQATRESLGLAPNAFVLAHVARVDPMKDHQTFLTAMSLLPDIHALLIGAGTTDLHDQARVMRLGRRSDIPQLLAASDAIISSSVSEGFSNALAEGMASGLPAIATDVGDARLIVGDTGYVVPPGNPRALADAILKLKTEAPERRAARSAAARSRIVDNFSLAVAVSRYTSLYRDLVRQRNSRIGDQTDEAL